MTCKYGLKIKQRIGAGQVPAEASRCHHTARSFPAPRYRSAASDRFCSYFNCFNPRTQLHFLPNCLLNNTTPIEASSAVCNRANTGCDTRLQGISPHTVSSRLSLHIVPPFHLGRTHETLLQCRPTRVSTYPAYKAV